MRSATVTGMSEEPSDSATGRSSGDPGRGLRGTGQKGPLTGLERQTWNSSPVKSAIAKSQFGRYLSRLRELNDTILRNGGLPFPHVEEASGHLDGLASRELRATVDLNDLRRLGAFFTGETLANQAANLCDLSQESEAIYDPACGCGDLLLAMARRMPLRDGLEETLRGWGKNLSGSDCVPEFVDITRQRLILLAAQRGARIDQDAVCLSTLEALLPDIGVANGPSRTLLSAADYVLLNPPFGQVAAPKETPWARGLVTDAALWTAAVMEGAKTGATIVAVLPDVLRSGSRYRKWRAAISQSLRIEEVRIVGQFDALTDVDVFLLHARKSQQKAPRSWPALEPGNRTLETLCSISVGPVVDKRDPKAGPLVPYITTRDLPQAGEYKASRSRRFEGRLFQPPFVVVRRTSRPSEGRTRLTPVLIRGARPVAVENHLIVVQPKKRSLAEANRLIEILRQPSTTDWLNQRIRTRHLTVSSLRDIPLIEAANAAAPAAP